jgi:hypothetical protein
VWVSELVWTQRQQEKFLASTGEVIQYAVRHYTDWLPQLCEELNSNIDIKLIRLNFKINSEWECK